MKKTVVSVLCLGLILLGSMGASALTVQSGVIAHQVIQCDKDGKAALNLAGAAGAAGMVQARAVGVQKEVVGWADLGTAANGAWAGTLAGVPAGGPYVIEVRVRDDAGKALESASVEDVLVGDVWVLAGQSNMQGVGNRVNVEDPHPLVHTFSMSYEWRLAQEPLHTLAESPDVVHANFKTPEERENGIKGWRDGGKGAGLGLAFAKEMVKRTGRPVGLVASAHGGTSMAQWNPELRDQGGASLYGSMCKQVEAAGGKVRGVVWYQGESDANPDAEPIYREKMKALVAAMRKDSGVPDLPFYYVQIGRFVVNNDKPGPWNAIQVDELALEKDLAPGGMVAAVDLSLDDGIHAGTPSLKVLGYRLANLAERDLFGGKVSAGPRFDKLEAAGTIYGQQLKVHFTGANARLQAAGRVNGFSISAGPDGADAPCIFNQEISAEDPNTIILWVSQLPDNPMLWYGRGFNPYCNVSDAANMALPVFGPVAVPK